MTTLSTTGIAMTNHQPEENIMTTAVQPADKVTLDGTEYTRSDLVPPLVDGEHVLIRSRDAGVFAGRLMSRDGAEVELADARRIWYWDGAATLSQLATSGTTKPGTCKFPAPVPSITVLGVCEVIPMTAAAVLSVGAVPPWVQK